MNLIILISIIIGLLFQSIAQKNYKGTALIFFSISCLTGAIFFAFNAGFKFRFDMGIIPYALCFALNFGMTIVGTFCAIKEGSLSLTSLVTSFSLIIPCVYGLIFLKEPSSVFLYVGLIFLFLSFILINVKKGDSKITPKWALYVMIAFFGNGICSTVLTAQQIAFNGAYKNEFMIIALLIISLVLFVSSRFREKEKFISSIKCGFGWMVGNGIVNGAVNLFVMILSRRMAASLMFPLVSGGSIILTWIVSRFVYREKLTKYQNAGLLFGIIAVVLLNL